MDSHTSVLDAKPNRSKRPSVGPADDESQVEPSSTGTSAYANKRPRISDERNDETLMQLTRSASPGSPIANAATQLLFGSSPLTEPDDNFPTEPEEVDDKDELNQAVLSSQQAEREGLILDNPGDATATHRSEPHQPEASTSLGTKEADVAVQVQIEEASQDRRPYVDPVISKANAEGSEGPVTSKSDHTIESDYDQAMGLSHLANLEDQRSHLSVVADQKKDLTTDDEFDEEFDNDPWFDAACLKSFDAINPLENTSTTGVSGQAGRMNAMTSGLSLFQTAGGGALPEVSETAKLASAALLSQADQALACTPSHALLQTTPVNQVQNQGAVVESFIDTRPAEQIKDHEIPTTVGFSTGRGKKVAVSTAAVAAKNARVAKLMQELMDIRNGAEVEGIAHAEANSKVNGESSHQGTEALQQPRMGSPRSTQAVFETPKKSGISAFTTAAGSQLGQISASAKAAVSSIFDAEQALAQEPTGSEVGTSARTEHPKASLFSTAAGATLATPSAEARKMATALFDEFGPDTYTKPVSTDYPLQPANSTVMSLGMPSSSFETPIKSVSRNMTSLVPVGTTKSSTVRPTSLQDISNLQPSSPAQQQQTIGFKTPLPAKTIHRASQAKPFQTPLPSSRHHPMSPAPSGRGLSPALPRRVGLGMTPRARSGLTERPRFVSPFRATVGTAAGEIAGSPNVKPRSGMRAIFSAPLMRKATKAPANTRPLQPCFDLTCPTERITMVRAGLKPNDASSSSVAAGLPPEISAINPVTAGFYTFFHMGAMRGPQDVMSEFQEQGLTHVDIEWVQNHWKMILWKLASIVKAKPDLFSAKWNYREVVRQLKYRYEREINRAQRSAVKRIQEQDSPPSLPMILCVSAIINSPADPASDGENAAERQALELTDGWYTIRANVDAPLSRALKSGKLRVGCKIGIAGAKLDADREGTEVLQALNKSCLRIAGNSTCLVEWYRSLGFTHKPFTSTLRSLSPDGGSIALLDVRVTKVFPLAYITTEKGKGTSPWSVEEEYKLQDEWHERYMQERSRLQAESERRLRGFEEDVDRLQSAIEGIDGSMDVYPCEDEELARFRAAPNKSQFLKTLTGTAVLSLFMRAKEDFQAEVSDAHADMEDQIRRLCPPRTTRSFQIIRIVDATTLRYPQLREAQLQVWDAKMLGENMIRDGARYQVSNLIPSQQKAWASFRDKGEIYLSTSKATTWKRRED